MESKKEKKIRWVACFGLFTRSTPSNVHAPEKNGRPSTCTLDEVDGVKRPKWTTQQSFFFSAFLIFYV